MSAEVLAALEARFEVHYDDGKSNTTVSIAQVVGRLNRVLGLSGWHHEVLREGFEPESEELWCYGRLSGDIDGVPFVREAYGGKKLARARREGHLPLNWTDDRKAAQ